MGSANHYSIAQEIMVVLNNTTRGRRDQLLSNRQEDGEVFLHAIKEVLDARVPLVVNAGDSVLQEWVTKLPGRRHQGVLLTCVRGCDTSPKEDTGKALSRAFRSEILNPHVGDPRLAKTFIEWCGVEELQARQFAFAKDHDAYPHHYVMHVVHAAEILGYFMPDWHNEHDPKGPEATHFSERRSTWFTFYVNMCRKMHMTPETKDELNARLGADEHKFFEQQ